jgi:hypothetical protein
MPARWRINHFGNVVGLVGQFDQSGVDRCRLHVLGLPGCFVFRVQIIRIGDFGDDAGGFRAEELLNICQHNIGVLNRVVK